ncbi:hypothetical protein [Chakrabartyella piscis]|uniref:hypothetical protein n=1 Tax=Chakrabartyella piscis TaxID=2918914 RepID=UPI0029586B19|nr:hypothetical protein [Chakrabartyella piscis]
MTMKKKLKKWKIALLTLAFCMCMFPTFAYAAEEAPLTITSGLELHEELKRVDVDLEDLEIAVAEVVASEDLETEGIKPQITFEKNRMIYGEALAGTVVTLEVEQLNDDGEWELHYSGEQTANSFGMFVFTMPLEVGRNQITLLAELEGYDSVCYQLQMERISEEIKEQLKVLVALPSVMQANKG